MILERKVYVLKDPRTSATRYVGQSVSPEGRLRAHAGPGASPRVRGWMAELAAGGLKPIVEVMPEGTEGEWIERLRPDLNSPLGGHGGGRPGAGRPPLSPADRAPPSLVISFRVSASQHAELTSAGNRRKPKLTPSGEAKRRVFKEES